jgi:hypothetical protein
MRAAAAVVVLFGLAVAGCSSSPAAEPVSDTRPVVMPAVQPAVAAPSTSLMPASTSTVVPLPFDEDVLDVVGPDTVVAFEQVRADERGRVVRWAKRSVSFALRGAANDVDVATLTAALGQLSAVEGLPELRLTDEGTADVVFHVVPRDEWGALTGSSFTDASDGLTSYKRDEMFALTSAVVVVNQASSQLQRNRTLVHELLHALGLGHHLCRSGMLYRDADYDPSWTLDSYDLALVEAYYPVSGVPRPPQSVPCAPLSWDSVMFNTELLWCEHGGVECFRVDPYIGPLVDAGPAFWRSGGQLFDHDPALFESVMYEGVRVLCQVRAAGERVGGCSRTDGSTVATVELWFDGSVMYDYDPRTHQVFVVDGKRLLCGLPPPSGRAACQFTQGSTVGSADLFFDGVSLFETPV